MVSRTDRATRIREAGTSIVEMAIVLPLLLTLVFAIGEFGIAYTRWLSLTNATREGARVGVVFRNPCNAGAVTTEIQTTVADFAESSGLDPGSIDIQLLRDGPCAGTGTQLEVLSSMPYDYVILAPLAGLAPTADLRARSVMRNE
jgi:Flp pilus assembly protein TadG